MTSSQLKEKWDKMSRVERLSAYGQACLADAQKRDDIPRFRKENNVGNFWYGAEATYIYGGGAR